MSFKQKFIVITTAILTLMLFSSCGERPIGWGVLLIEDTENKLTAGDILPVYQESEIRDVFTVSTAGGDAMAEVDRWKISFHEKESKAAAFAESYSRWIDIYAKSTLNGLSIRAEADTSSARTYKLRKGQTIKVIGRIEETQNIANHDGYWYQVLTEDGSSGYCFDKNLDIYDRKSSGADSGSSLDQEKLDIFLSKPFRPEYYRDMARSSLIDLTRFRTGFGIFAYPEENKVTLVTEDLNLVFDYDTIVQNSSGRFIFEGTSLQIEVRSDSRIAAYYSASNQEYAVTMFYIPDVEELIETEVERRAMLVEKIYELGTVSSSAYGRISFEEAERFSWTRNTRLVPNVIPESADSTGSIRLDYLPGPMLRNDYDGVLSFAFDGVPGRGLVNFLFELSDLGIKLVYVPAEDIDKNIVERENPSPLVIFMSGAGE